MSPKKGTCLAALFFLLILLGVKDNPGPQAHASPQGKAASAAKTERFIAAHTSGTVSARDTLSVRFLGDIKAGTDDKVPLKFPPFAFKPPLKGTSYWIHGNTLVFEPESPMPSGAHFKATLDVGAVLEEAAGAEPFAFDFDVIRQDFEIHLSGIQATAGEGRRTAVLPGSITLADSADLSEVKHVLSARQGERALAARWSAGRSPREFLFTLEGITREDAPSRVDVAWDGSALGSDRKGSRSLEVPAAHDFSVVGARAVRGDRQVIEVRFSDPLDPAQNLAGLIRAEDLGDLRFTIDRAVVKVFSSSTWPRQLDLHVSPGIRNTEGHRLTGGRELTVFFEDLKPEVNFAGKGVILPTGSGLTLPVEAVNIRAVKIRVIKIPESNIPQFLQVNELDGSSQLTRVGRPAWEKIIPLTDPAPALNERQRFGLDLRPLLETQAHGLFRVEISFDGRHILYPCAAGAGPEESGSIPGSRENWDAETQASSWGGYEEFSGTSWRECWEERLNPCHPCFYREFHDHNVVKSRNVLISDIGILAKKGEGNRVTVFVTDLKSARPLGEAQVTALDYQQQALASALSDGDGRVVLETTRGPFLLTVRKGAQVGYLRLDDGSALSVSHFDVSGRTVKQGLKGCFYGERGVWRPGNPIHMTFILVDESGKLPEDHPVRFEFLDPRGRLVETVTDARKLGDFHCFTLTTAQDGPTGAYNVRARIGNTFFEMPVRIETIMPNRLKIALDLGPDQKALSRGRLKGVLEAAWLHGAAAKNLKARVDLTFTSARTVFPAYREFTFDDPVREYQPESLQVYEGGLDRDGRADFKTDLKTANLSPGMLSARFDTRVYEPGGAFSRDQLSVPYHPYERYVGVALPTGDEARGMLLTDTLHKARIVMVTRHGKPVKDARVEVELYKIQWRWWWETGRENLASYLGTNDFTSIQKEVVEIRDGKAEWPFEIKHPSWGRYLLRVKDLGGDHVTGDIFYVDWPGWAGRSGADAPGGAVVLSLSADKEKVSVGEIVRLTLPEARNGRALLSLENGSRVLRADWVEPADGRLKYEFTATPDMAPNVYVHATLLQPHGQTANDLPIRMYGVVSIEVEDPGTRLEPLIECEDVLRPESRAVFKVTEENGRAMTYTLALVDEGLLDLTRFATPDPWKHFYHRESLGVKTWDVYDHVLGAYGIQLERLLAIGGGGRILAEGGHKANRFPPMVRFLGPFSLEAGAAALHEVDIPIYVGSVRAMVVAGHGKAFGSSEKAVAVRRPLMVLGTLPRVLGPGEEVRLPVSVFALEDSITGVTVTVSTEGPLQVDGESHRILEFTQTGDELVEFALSAGPRPGMARVDIRAASGRETARHVVELDVRSPMESVTDVAAMNLDPGESRTEVLRFPGVPGTNKVTLEVSRIPPLNLTKRLDYLVHYPHGCVEQITSTAFPQLFLNRLVDLSPDRREAVENHVKRAIQRLSSFQTADGGFAYWPGQGGAQPWATSYAGNFLLEARQTGYFVPAHVLNRWVGFQKEQALSWTAGPERSELDQAYRLYTLSLAGEPELSSMNRLRESLDLPTAARWRLAAAYVLAGQPEAAAALAAGATTEVPPYKELSNTFGSHLRDKAMILETLTLMKRHDEAQRLLRELSDALGSSRALSTQTTACALTALARLAGVTGAGEEMAVSCRWNGTQMEIQSSRAPVARLSLDPCAGSSGEIRVTNPNGFAVYPRVVLTGTPEAGSETAASNGLELRILYTDGEGKELDPARLGQGRNVTVEVSVTNTGRGGTCEEIALTCLLPSGWEILGTDGGSRDYEFQDVRDDRIHTYFDLAQGGTKTFRFLLHASYLGRFYLPMTVVETMYDADIHAREPGRWVEVVRPGT